MTLKSLVLDYMSGNPGLGLPTVRLEQCTAILQQFVGQLRCDEAAVRANDSTCTRISIVMPSYNQAKFIERSILSVLNQKYPNLQFIIMDGGSTDGTLDVIRKYEKHLCWRSESDRGQSDALNKALMLADGELVSWQNSDDVYFPGAFQRMHEASRRYPRAVLYSGSVARIDGDDRLLRVPRYSRPNVQGFLYGGFPLSSQGLFWRRAVQVDAGLFDVDLHYAMDFDFGLRLVCQGSAELVPELVGGFRLHEGTKTSSAPERGHAEVSAIRRKYGVDDSTKWWRMRRNALFISALFQRLFLVRCHCVTVSNDFKRL